MKIEYYKTFSSFLNRDMEFKVYGHGGKPCIAFPCQNGRFFDYENRGMFDKLQAYIDSGKIQIFAVDSVDIESWSDEEGNPYYRINRQEQFYNYIMNELVPYLHYINECSNGYKRNDGILTFGCSMGAYHAMNFFLRRPDVFDATLSLSGIYHAGFFFKGFSNMEVYLNSPIDSLNNMQQNHPYVDMYRKSKIIVCVGQGAWENECLDDTRGLDYQFKRLNVPAWIDYWGYDIAHDWPSWLEQAPYFMHYILD